MAAAHGLFHLERCDRMAQDMTHVGRVPIEALDLVQHDSSIYDYRIYDQVKELFRDGRARSCESGVKFEGELEERRKALES